jgi:hypothetical protein
MPKSVTIRFPQDGDTVPSDFTVDGVVSARMDPVDLTLSLAASPSTVVTADGRWSFDYTTIADGPCSLTAMNKMNMSTHVVNFTVSASAAVSGPRRAAQMMDPKVRITPTNHDHEESLNLNSIANHP